MKKLLLLAITGMFLVSCGGGGWSSDDQAKFKNELKKEIAGDLPADVMGDFCDCMLEPAMDKWSSYADLDNDLSADAEEWGFNTALKCVEKLGIEY